MSLREDAAALRTSWDNEQQSVYLYRILAAVETDENKRRLFKALALEAEEQGRAWARKMARNYFCRTFSYQHQKSSG